MSLPPNVSPAIAALKNKQRVIIHCSCEGMSGPISKLEEVSDFTIRVRLVNEFAWRYIRINEVVGVTVFDADESN